MKRIVVFVIGVAIGSVMTYLWTPRLAHSQIQQIRVLGTANVLAGDRVFHLEDFNAPIGWRELPYGSHTLPPVPPSSLVALQSGYAITESGEGWIETGAGWVSHGIVPGVSPARSTTWGELKSTYR
jgi:hypothetical protein